MSFFSLIMEMSFQNPEAWRQCELFVRVWGLSRVHVIPITRWLSRKVSNGLEKLVFGTFEKYGEPISCESERAPHWLMRIDGLLFSWFLQSELLSGVQQGLVFVFHESVHRSYMRWRSEIASAFVPGDWLTDCMAVQCSYQKKKIQKPFVLHPDHDASLPDWNF